MIQRIIDTNTTDWEESEVIVNLQGFNSCVVQLKTIEGQFSSAVLTTYVSLDGTEWFNTDGYEIKGTDSPYWERTASYTLSADGLSNTIDLKGCNLFKLKVTTLNGSAHKVIAIINGNNKLLSS